MMRVAFLALLLMAQTGRAGADCRQALALGLDVSGSVDSHEYRLQLDGLAAALSHPDVVRALLETPGPPVHLAIYEWSGPGYQRLLLDWAALTDREGLGQVAARLANTTRVKAPPGTALGTAMQYGAALLARQPACWKRTLDISGDGKHNLGPHPRDVRATLARRSLTVNALVIGADAPRGGDARQVEIGELCSYFKAWVITGPDAFVETALGFQDYEAAMVRKLVRELEGLVFSATPPARPDAPRVLRLTGSETVVDLH
jgi:hypothetical protein